MSLFRKLLQSERTKSEGPSAPCTELGPLTVRVVPAGSHALAYTPASGGVHLIPKELAAVLARIQGFRSLPEQIRTLAGEPGQDFGAATFVSPARRELERRGLLITREGFLQAVRRTAAANEERPRITTVAWVTRGRPEALGRSVASFAVNAARHGRDPQWLVCDDGGGQEQQATRTALVRAVREAGITLRYCGSVQKEWMIRRLCEAAGPEGVSENALRFALFGVPGASNTCGANRNTVLLATAGRLTLSADDDTVCELAMHPQADEGLSISSAFDPGELFFWPDRDRLLAGVKRIDADLLGRHEMLLGRSAAACMDSVSAVDLREASAELVDLLLSAQPHVAATSAGYFGDSGIDHPAILLWLTGRSRERLTASKEAYRAALTVRETLRCSRRPAIGESAHLSGGSLGLDGRRTLPPFFPLGRNEDMGFAARLRMCSPEALIGRPDIAVYHDPVEARAYSPKALIGMEPTFYELMTCLLQAYTVSPSERTAEERLRGLGTCLLDLARLPAGDLVDAVVPHLLLARSRRIAYAESLLHQHGGEPSYWAREVERYIEEVRQHGMTATAVVPAEVRRGRTEQEAAAALQSVLCLFGELLFAWPLVWRAAKDLTESDGWVFETIQ